MAEQESVYLWSTTALTNGSVDPAINFAEGQLPSTVNNSARAIMTAMARFLKDTDGSLTTAGSANAYTLTINGRMTPLATGHRLSFKASFANTGAATLAVTNADAVALGAKAIRAPGDIALAASQIISGGRYDVEYDAAANSAAGAWMLLNPAPIGSIVIQTFTSGGTYTPTAGMRYCIIECWGAGGGGGGTVAAGANTFLGAGGGGAGSKSQKVASASAVGASKTVTIGTAGTAGTAGGGTGGAGGDTSVGTLCIGKGGLGGIGQAGTVSVAGGAGGTGGTGDMAGSGMRGLNGNIAANFGVGVNGTAGDGGSTEYGGGGAGATGVLNNATAGGAATGFGSGGGGAGAENSGAGTAAGGVGAGGLVLITEFF